MDVKQHDDEGMLEIQGEQKYPYVWLRDNCLCPECYQPSSKERLLLMQQLDPDIKPSQVKVSAIKTGLCMGNSGIDGKQN